MVIGGGCWVSWMLCVPSSPDSFLWLCWLPQPTFVHRTCPQYPTSIRRRVNDDAKGACKASWWAACNPLGLGMGRFRGSVSLYIQLLAVVHTVATMLESHAHAYQLHVTHAPDQVAWPTGWTPIVRDTTTTLPFARALVEHMPHGWDPGSAGITVCLQHPVCCSDTHHGPSLGRGTLHCKRHVAHALCICPGCRVRSVPGVPPLTCRCSTPLRRSAGCSPHR